jgi:chromosome segregation ATPase
MRKQNMVSVFILFAIFGLNAAAAVEKDRTITQVVKLLQGMLQKSQVEGDEERVIYAKFKCYCDQSEAEKKASIKQLTTQIELLENQIAEIQGDTGGLSSECADLKARLASNEAAQEEATSVRDKEKKAFLAEKADLEEAIVDSKEAIEVLSEVGGDQTKSVGADHKQFMAGKKSAMLQKALSVASRFMNPNQRTKAKAFFASTFHWNVHVAVCRGSGYIEGDAGHF